MSSAVPAPPGAPDPVSGAPPAAVAPARKPRKRFILIGTGIGLVLVLGVGLFTSFGAGKSSNGGGGGSAPGPGDPVPSFSATNIGPSGASRVVVPVAGGDNGAPTVLLFFGAWCPACHGELPPLAAAVRAQDKAGGALSHVRVIGVDSEDRLPTARSFIDGAGVTFPVAYDPDLTITEGDFYFVGDPHAVFVKADGEISEIAPSSLTPASFTADEQALVRSG
jgi:cytochrome c biogenesis protein CcmG, thiol:disulfide interchange protein DsbE